MCLPFLQILANLLVVVIGRGAVILESRIAAPVFVGRASEIDESRLDGSDQAEALQSLGTVRRIGLGKCGRDDMQPDNHIALYCMPPEFSPDNGIKLYEDGRRRERTQLGEACSILVPQTYMVDGRCAGHRCIGITFPVMIDNFIIHEADMRQTRLYIIEKS